MKGIPTYSFWVKVWGCVPKVWRNNLRIKYRPLKLNKHLLKDDFWKTMFYFFCLVCYFLNFNLLHTPPQTKEKTQVHETVHHVQLFHCSTNIYAYPYLLGTLKRWPFCYIYQFFFPLLKAMGSFSLMGSGWWEGACKSANESVILVLAGSVGGGYMRCWPVLFKLSGFFSRRNLF